MRAVLRFCWRFSALVVALVLAARADAAVVNSPADDIQLKEGCSGATASFCDLRIYQVMVESFVDGDPLRNYNAGYGTSHHRGDIRGITNSLDYIQSLGLNAIWLTPVFDSAAGQAYEGGGTNLKLDATGYYARNYFQIDPKFGTLDDARALVDAAHDRGMYVFFDGVFGHHKGNLVPSPTGKLPASSSPGVVNYSSQQSVEFYKEVATYWIDELGIDGWRLDQAYQVPTSAWRQIRTAVEDASAARAAAGEQWGTLGYMVAEVWSGADYIQEAAFGTNANPALPSAFDFPVRYATVGVLAGEENGLSGRSATELANGWSYGAHDGTYPDEALPNLMLGNHDLVRFGDLLQRAGIAGPEDAEYWTRHRLAFLVQGAYSGPITRYYGEELGDEVPNYANRVTTNCANLGLCDDHVARTSAKIPGVTIDEDFLTADQQSLLAFHEQLMQLRSDFPALSHGTRQHLYSDNSLFVDLKTFGNEQIVFAMNVSDAPAVVELSASLFESLPTEAWDLLAGEAVDVAGGYLNISLAPLSGRYILLAAGPPLIPGDFDQSGTVDAADYTIWRDTLGSTTDLRANGSRTGASSGVVDTADYEVWRRNFGRSSLAGAGGLATVPEPTTCLLVAIVFAASTLNRLAMYGRRLAKVPQRSAGL
jgi:glycosidase